ncbi:MAG: phosphotransferase [Anaerolineae bacterium]|nr:phosphotransferase [Anaerolineae bacterium]
MRISLLMEREPFGAILEKTLEDYWSARSGQEYQVSWHPGRPKLSKGIQVWLVNIYLNAIFTPELEAAGFEPVRREFSHSLSRWRRPLQRDYVAAATSKWASRRLAQAVLHVQPAIPQACQWLIVAGNHRLRILDHQVGSSTSVLKAGFDSTFMQRELEARRLAETLRLPVPVLRQCAGDASWFTEDYVIGTPLNRLPDDAQAQSCFGMAADALKDLIAHTRAEEPVADYVSRIQTRSEALIARNTLLSAAQRTDLQTLIRTLASLFQMSKASIITSLTHGDFQPANLLATDEQTWIIDWEYSARRQTPYDLLTYGLRSRRPDGLADRLHAFVTDGISALPDQWPGCTWHSSEARLQSAILFALEDLLLHLEENANPHFTRLGDGLLSLHWELINWLSS